MWTLEASNENGLHGKKKEAVLCPTVKKIKEQVEL